MAQSTGLKACSSRFHADSRLNPRARRVARASNVLQSSTALCRIASSSSSTPIPTSLQRSPPLRQSPSNGRRPEFATRALTPDAPPDWTLDQIAGLVFGLGMVASVFLAYKVDSVVARQQRRRLGLCELCGGLNDVDGGGCAERDCPRRGK